MVRRKATCRIRAKQFRGDQRMAPGGAVKVLLAHAPPCPAALHLDSPALRQNAAARKLLLENCLASAERDAFRQNGTKKRNIAVDKPHTCNPCRSSVCGFAAL